jgi:ABC-type nitrate/sulfonate/bicarbonate transport system substrate-binding protein
MKTTTIHSANFRRSRWGAALATALALTSVGLVSSGASASSSKAVIKYGSENYVLNTPELAAALGYLPNIQLDAVTDGLTIPPAEFIQTVLKGQVTYGFSNFGELITANTDNEPVKAVIAFNGNVGAATGGIYVSANSNIRSAKDLIGKKVAITPGTLSQLIFDQYLQENNIPLSKVQEVSISYTSDGGEQEVRSGELAAYDTSGSSLAAALSRGGLRRLASDAQVLGSIELDAYFFADSYIKANPSVVKEFVTGTAKAVVYSQTHTPAQTLAVYNGYLASHGQKALELTASELKYQGELKGGVITSRSFTDNEKWLEQIGELKPGAVTASQVYTNQFNPYSASAS